MWILESDAFLWFATLAASTALHSTSLAPNHLKSQGFPMGPCHGHVAESAGVCSMGP